MPDIISRAAEAGAKYPPNYVYEGSSKLLKRRDAGPTSSVQEFAPPPASGPGRYGAPVTPSITVMLEGSRPMKFRGHGRSADGRSNR